MFPILLCIAFDRFNLDVWNCSRPPLKWIEFRKYFVLYTIFLFISCNVYSVIFLSILSSLFLLLSSSSCQFKWILWLLKLFFHKLPWVVFSSFDCRIGEILIVCFLFSFRLHLIEAIYRVLNIVINFLIFWSQFPIYSKVKFRKREELNIVITLLIF